MAPRTRSSGKASQPSPSAAAVTAERSSRTKISSFIQRDCIVPSPLDGIVTIVLRRRRGCVGGGWCLLRSGFGSGNCGRVGRPLHLDSADEWRIRGSRALRDGGGHHALGGEPLTTGGILCPCQPPARTGTTAPGRAAKQARHAPRRAGLFTGMLAGGLSRLVSHGGMELPVPRCEPQATTRGLASMPGAPGTPIHGPEPRGGHPESRAVSRRAAAPRAELDRARAWVGGAGRPRSRPGPGDGPRARHPRAGGGGGRALGQRGGTARERAGGGGGGGGPGGTGGGWESHPGWARAVRAAGGPPAARAGGGGAERGAGWVGTAPGRGLPPAAGVPGALAARAGAGPVPGAVGVLLTRCMPEGRARGRPGSTCTSPQPTHLPFRGCAVVHISEVI